MDSNIKLRATREWMQYFPAQAWEHIAQAARSAEGGDVEVVVPNVLSFLWQLIAVLEVDGSKLKIAQGDNFPQFLRKTLGSADALGIHVTLPDEQAEMALSEEPPVNVRVCVSLSKRQAEIVLHARSAVAAQLQQYQHENLHEALCQQRDEQWKTFAGLTTQFGPVNLYITEASEATHRRFQEQIARFLLDRGAIRAPRYVEEQNTAHNQALLIKQIPELVRAKLRAALDDFLEAHGGREATPQADANLLSAMQPIIAEVLLGRSEERGRRIA